MSKHSSAQSRLVQHTSAGQPARPGPFAVPDTARSYGKLPSMRGGQGQKAPMTRVFSHRKGG